jgi:hypothetical protein
LPRLAAELIVFPINRRSTMNCSLRLLTAAGATLALFTLAAPAHAQATRTWTSGTGNDANPCSRTAPCKTFAGAISKTAAFGEINCLDPNGAGAVTITKSITINCHEVFGSILASGSPGITISAAATDKVILRNIQINGILGTVTPGTIGIRILTASEVSIEDCVITQMSQQGILDARTSGNTRLAIKNTTVSYNGAAGVSLTATGTSFTLLDNVLSLNNLNGVSAGSTNNVMVKRSALAGNSGAGATVSAGGQIQIDDTVIANNGSGLNSAGTIKISNSDLMVNATAIVGPVISFGNNRLTGTLGTAPTAAGGPTENLGQF